MYHANNSLRDAGGCLEYFSTTAVTVVPAVLYTLVQQYEPPVVYC